MSSQLLEPLRVTATLPDADRHAMIAEAAYFRALERGFAPGHELEDWIAAEAQIDAHIMLG
jgi:Protein of unknown function (DUF2934)